MPNVSKAEQNSGTRLIRAPQKKTAQRELRAYVFITVTRDHALNNAVKSSKKHSSSAQSSPGHITSLSFKAFKIKCSFIFSLKPNKSELLLSSTLMQQAAETVQQRSSYKTFDSIHKSPTFTIVLLWQKSRIFLLSIINILNMLKEKWNIIKLFS